MIPEGQSKYNDLIDVVIASAQRSKETRQDDGTLMYEQYMDENILWWKTLSVNANTLSRLALEIEEWERMASIASSYMSHERASQIMMEILGVGASMRRSIDAKSSETQRDKQNSQSSLLHMINSNKVERVYSTKGEVKKSLLSGFLGRDKEKDMENDS